MKNSIIAFMLVLALIYLAGSFTFASFDIKQWDLFTRGFIAFIAVCAGGMAFGMFYEDKK